MSLQFTDILTIYFVIAVVLVGGGALELHSVDIITEILVEDDGQLHLDESVTADMDVEQDDGGLLSNFLGPLTQGMDNVFGGGLLAAGALIIDLFRFLGWPLAVTYELGMPLHIQLLASVLVFGLIMGAFKMLRPSA